MKQKRALIVVDYQVDFVSGSLGFEGAYSIENAICEKIDDYRENGGDIIFTLDTHKENYLTTNEGSNLPVVHCLEDSEGWRLYGKVAEKITTEDTVFIKSAFGSMALAQHLSDEEYESVELCGLVSNICVITNAILAKTALPEAEIIVDAAATASFDQKLNEETLDVMAGLQIKIIGR